MVWQQYFSSSTLGVLHRQSDLESAVRRLFPQENVLVNSRTRASIRNPSSGLPLELDIWLPDLKVAFEFQDPYHYVTTWYSNVSIDSVKQNDDHKLEQVQRRAESLIIIPCWWDGLDESLVATIKENRPDLLRHHDTKGIAPISLAPPTSYFNENAVPGTGELMVPSFPRAYFDPTDWWLSEKYDGVRACWSPKDRLLFSRRGSIISLPIFEKSFPGAYLDGELWFGRGSFQESQSLTGEIVDWSFLRFVVFDWPDVIGNSMEFEGRYSLLLASVPSTHPFAICSSNSKCENKKSTIKITNDIMKNGGEGVVLRKPHSFYVHGRTDELLKFKASRMDQEGLVIGVEPSYFLIKLPTNAIFKVIRPLKLNESEIADEVTQEEQKESKKNNVSKTDDEIQLGNIITFSYTSFTSLGRPANPKNFRIRKDVKWEQIMFDFLNSVPRPLLENENTQNFFSDNIRQPHGHWTVDDGENSRKFFDDFAFKLGFDPLVSDNWYSISFTSVIQEKHGGAVMAHYNNSLKRALISLYPNIGLEESKFSIVPKNYWRDESNRRKFFDEYASIRGFDSLVAKYWYDIKREDVVQEKGGTSVLEYYGSSLPKALMEIYPQFRKDPKFLSSLRNRPISKEKRKIFFDRIAESKGFDPLKPESWLLVSETDINSHTLGAAILKYYEGSLKRALRNTYPHFDGVLLHRMPVNYWKVIANRKKFFDEYAQENNFDPILPENWYNIPVSEFLKIEGHSFLVYHKFSVKSALLEAYPDIGLDRTKFKSSKKGILLKDK